jgi:hypothetical protein
MSSEIITPFCHPRGSGDPVFRRSLSLSLDPRFREDDTNGDLSKNYDEQFTKLFSKHYTKSKNLLIAVTKYF